MRGGEAQGGGVVHLEQVMQVGSGVVAAQDAVAGRVHRTRGAAVVVVEDVQEFIDSNPSEDEENDFCEKFMKKYR